jgi:hypothetical protein
LINRHLKTILEKLSSKTKNKIDDIFVEYLIKFINIGKYFLAIYVFFKFLTINKEYLIYVDKAFYIFFLVFFIYYITSFFNIIFELVLLKNSKFK